MTNKILIVDDEQNNLDILNECLRNANFKVLIAKSGETALKQINYIKPDLILLDIMMPGIDGFETCKCLKKNETTKDIPIIFITAKTDAVDKIRGLEAGAVDYITKPFHLAEIITRINKHLTVSNLRKKLEIQNAQLQDYVYHLGSLATLGKAVNEAQDVNQMMDSAMKITLSIFDCDRAWLIYPCDPNATSWQVPIEATKTEFTGTNILNTDVPMEPEMSEIMQHTLLANGPIAFGPDYEHKIPSTVFKQFSTKSQLVMTIHSKVGKPWLFGLYQCSHARVWTETEFKLFRDFGHHIGVSLGFSISIEKLQKNEEQLSRTYYHGFIGASRSMRTIYQIIDNVATSKASILITGETGTGKEVCAEAIYKESRRADKPFLICNCAAIPENLIESHLFGHVKGAFTGAINEQKGLIHQANEGTLFLDEIGELPFTMQSTLLRFVQTKTFSKVGSHKLEKVDVRLICATNRDLMAEAKNRQFREDLYFRINTIEIKLPALRIRGHDILLLANFFLKKFTKEEDKDFQKFNTEANKKLLEYEWPGNVRQLQNTIHNSVVLNEGKIITDKMIIIRKTDEFQNTITTHPIPDIDSAITSSDIVIMNKFCSFKDIEKEIILKTIRYCSGNIIQAAKLLKISKSYIYKLKKQWK
ncbi:sigma 54-interacting transcriptional regulator [Candidatus Halobeggiatoa sp. HSG11]|nr:sigma 54-interacting transcriptional regulator [Candidatus Halobeggiatoa sp. HSG11]